MNLTWRKRGSYNWAFWLVLFGIICILVYILRSVLLPFVLGIIIGYLLDPVADKFEKLGLSRTMATIVVMLLTVIILVPSAILLFSIIDKELGTFISSVPTYISSFIKKSEPLLASLQDNFPALETDKIRGYMQNHMANGLKFIGSVLKQIISGGFAIINIISLLLITPVVAFYMLRDWNKFVSNINGLLPRKSKDTLQEQFRQIDKTLAGFIRGQLSVCVLLGLMYSLGLYAVGLELGVLIGFLAGLISFIPYFGSITGFVISICVAIAQFGSWEPIAMVAGVFMVGQFIEGNFLTPKLVGDSVGLHPVWIMFALLAGGVLLGFLGLMIAVPVAAIIGVLARGAISNYKESSVYLDD